MIKTYAHQWFSGRHLSSLAVRTPNDPQFQPEFEDADNRVQAAVPFYAVAHEHLTAARSTTDP